MPEGKSSGFKAPPPENWSIEILIERSFFYRNAKEIPPPIIQPVGLHFRCHHWFRTDVYVEYPEPLQIPVIEDPLHSASLICTIGQSPRRNSIGTQGRAIPAITSSHQMHQIGKLTGYKNLSTPQFLGWRRKLTAYSEEVKVIEKSVTLSRSKRIRNC